MRVCILLKLPEGQHATAASASLVSQVSTRSGKLNNSIDCSVGCGQKLTSNSVNPLGSGVPPMNTLWNGLNAIGK
eukprot:3427278-Amphidinium_carterae.1